MNRLYYGDCLTVLNEMGVGGVDLVYLDPPFNSNRSYNAIYKDETGRPLPDQIEAFCDMWTLNEEREREIRTMPILMRESGIDDNVAQFWKTWVNALRQTHPRLLAYLSYMVTRLLAIRAVLSNTGSIYYHCDPTSSHYVKVMMDGIFGHNNFQNEIVWWYDTGGMSKSRWSRKHDTLLFYANGKNPVFNVNDVMDEKNENQKKRLEYAKRQGENSTYRLTSTKKYPHDVWKIHAINPKAKERMGYATQKPVELMERIIKASSNPGDLVLDPFCGCATTLEAAQKLDRNWIGIDIAIHAVKRVASVRLRDRLGLVEGKDFTIEGVPRDVEGAADLWTRDKYHFQKWAVEQVDGFVTTRQTADGGIDGRLYFYPPKGAELESMVIEVKGGENLNVTDVRSLHGVLERDDAMMAGLIVLHEPKPRQAANFAKEMASAGDEIMAGVAYPRMQILTVQQILEGQRFKTPSVAGRLETPSKGGMKGQVPLDWTAAENASG